MYRYLPQWNVLCGKDIYCSTHCHPRYSDKNTADSPMSEKTVLKYLMKEHINDVDINKWLTNLHIKAVSEMLKCQQSSIGGLLD